MLVMARQGGTMTQEQITVSLNGESLCFIWGQMGEEVIGLLIYLFPRVPAKLPKPSK